MRHHDFRDMPEYRTATGFPVGVILVSIVGITGYLIAGGAFTENDHVRTRVYVPLEGPAVHLKQ